jgi:hypothetical protein
MQTNHPLQCNNFKQATCLQQPVVYGTARFTRLGFMTIKLQNFQAVMRTPFVKVATLYDDTQLIL